MVELAVRPEGQSGDQHIGLIEIFGFVQGIRIFIPALSVRQTRSFQKVCTLGLVHGIQNLDMTIRAVVGFGFAELHDVGNLHEAELNALNGVPVAGFAVAKGGSIAAQNIVYAVFIVNTGGNIGAVPHAVLFGTR